MSQEKIIPSHFSQDIQEFLSLLDQYQVRYLVVGGEAVIFYGHARLTGDIDFFYDLGKENAGRLFEALKAFWKGSIPGISNSEELEEEGLIVQFGCPPYRIDLISRIDGVPFEKAWNSREISTLKFKNQQIPIYYIGLDALILNKEGVGRPRDLEDLKYLRMCVNRKPKK